MPIVIVLSVTPTELPPVGACSCVEPVPPLWDDPPVEVVPPPLVPPVVVVVPVVWVLFPLMLPPEPLDVKPPLLVAVVPVPVDVKLPSPVLVPELVEVAPVSVEVPAAVLWTFPYCPQAVPISANNVRRTNHRLGAGPVTFSASSSVAASWPASWRRGPG